MLGEQASVLGALALFAWMVFGTAPSVFWEDSGNLVASAWVLGVPHPPGEPGWVVPARLAMLLPIGDIAFRANLLSAVAVTAVCLPLLGLVRASVGPSPAALVVVAGVLAQGVRLQAVRAEVYGPTTLLLLIALWAAVALSGRRASAFAALALGGAATIHPLLAVVAVPGVVVARGMASPIRFADVPTAIFCGVAPGAMYALLPIRAHRIPSRTWGIPSEPGALLDVLLARDFARNFGGEQVDAFANLLVVWEHHRAAGAVLMLLAMLGTVGRRLESRHRALLFAAPVWMAGNAATQAFQNKVYPDNPDLLGYLGVGVLVLVPLAAAGLHIAWVRPRSAPWGAALKTTTAAAAALLLFGQALAGLDADRRTDDLPARLAKTQAHGLPPGAILMTSGNNTAFVWSWLDVVERRRVDITVLHRVLLGHPHERMRLDQHGEFTARTGLPWAPPLRSDPLAMAGGSMGPFFLEVREVDVAAAALSRHGLVRGPVEASSSTTRAVERLFAEFAARPYVADPTAAGLVAQYRAVEAALGTER